MRTKGYFEGWYYKQLAGGHSLALIPGRSEHGAFIQVITDQKSYNIEYDLREYQRKGEQIRIGESKFSPDGIHLDIRSDVLTLTGYLRYHNLTPIHGDIMGPFRFLPMECRHGICSMLHQVDGKVLLDGAVLDFTNGRGYIESDSGKSFPAAYMWVHCNDFAENCSIMVSVAKIPLASLRFWGCIAVIWLDGREYRLATYRGVKIVRLDSNRLILKQGSLCLDVKMEKAGAHELYAPHSGSMSRTIRESVACPTRFRFSESGRVLFEASSNRASCEYDINQK